MPPAAKMMKLACIMLWKKVSFRFEHACDGRLRHLPKDNHKGHGVGHVRNPEPPSLPRSPIDHTQDEKAKDTRGYHGDIEAYRHGVDGSPPVEEEQRHHLVSVRHNSSHDL